MDLEDQYDKVYRYCARILFDKQLAQDLTQEAFLRTMTQLGSLDGRDALPYLYTVARNLCIDNFRRQTTVPLEEAGEESYDPTAGWEDHVTLAGLLDHLPPEDRELLLLRYANDLPVAVICRITGLSRFAVHRRLKKLLHQIKETMEQEGGLP